MTDEELTKLIVNGDNNAWNTLVERYTPQLLHYLQSWTTYHTAQEILQETWLAAFKGIEKNQLPKKFGAWIYTIAHRQAINHHYRCKEEKHLILNSDVMEKVNEQEELHAEQVADALNEMDAGNEYDQRKAYCIRQFYWHKATIAELSIELNIPKGTVKRTLHKARGDIKKILTRTPKEMND